MDSDGEIDERFAAAGFESEEGSEDDDELEIETSKKKRKTDRRVVSDTQEKKKKPGVIYLSRSPMTPNKKRTC